MSEETMSEEHELLLPATVVAGRRDEENSKAVRQVLALNTHQRASIRNLTTCYIVLSLIEMNGNLFGINQGQFVYSILLGRRLGSNFQADHDSRPCFINKSDPDQQKLDAVQEEAAMFQLYLLLAQTLPGIVTLLPLGVYSDHVGRRFLFLLDLCGFLCISVSTTLVAYFRLDLRWMLLGYGLDGLCGGPYLIALAANVYTADNTPPTGTRTLGLALSKIGSIAAHLLGFLFGGYFVQLLGFNWPFVTVDIVIVLTLIFAAIFLAESSPRCLRSATSNSDVRSDRTADSASCAPGSPPEPSNGPTPPSSASLVQALKDTFGFYFRKPTAAVAMPCGRPSEGERRRTHKGKPAAIPNYGAVTTRHVLQYEQEPWDPPYRCSINTAHVGCPCTMQSSDLQDLTTRRAFSEDLARAGPSFCESCKSTSRRNATSAGQLLVSSTEFRHLADVVDTEPGCPAGVREDRRMEYWLGIATAFFLAIPYLSCDSINILYYINAPFCWQSRKIGIFIAVSGVVGFVVCPVTLKVRSLLGVKEEWAGLLGFISLAAMYLAYSVAVEDWMLYVGAAIGSFYGLTFVVLKSMMSQRAPTDMQGSVFAAIAFLETASLAAGGTAFNNVYSHTVATYKGAVYLVAMGFALLAFGFMISYVIVTRRSTSNSADRTLNPS